MDKKQILKIIMDGLGKLEISSEVKAAFEQIAETTANNLKASADDLAKQVEVGNSLQKSVQEALKLNGNPAKKVEREDDVDPDDKETPREKASREQLEAVQKTLADMQKKTADDTLARANAEVDGTVDSMVKSGKIAFGKAGEFKEKFKGNAEGLKVVAEHLAEDTGLAGKNSVELLGGDGGEPSGTSSFSDADIEKMSQEEFSKNKDAIMAAAESESII